VRLEKKKSEHMATATLPTDATVSKLTSTARATSLEPPGDVLYEVVAGRILELPPLGAYQSDIASLLGRFLNESARAARAGRVFFELLFRIDVARDLSRRPDVAFVSASRWPYGKRAPNAEAWYMVPDLAVEVVSKSNTAEGILAKLEDYFRAGTQLVWVIYPTVRHVYVYTSPTDVRILAEPADLDGGEVVPAFRVPLRRLFEDEPDVGASSAGADEHEHGR
jgi:Uma2 family endonuclease